MRLLRRALNGGAVGTVLDSDGPKFLTDWSSDGQTIAFNTQWPDYRDMHIWTMRLDGASIPRPLSKQPVPELGAYFSPARAGMGPRWIAYTSAETGRYEVYVSDFPSEGRRWTASTKGGWMPHWSRDGSELFFLSLEGTLMLIPVHTGRALELGTPKVLFTTELRPTPIQTLTNQYAVSQDGQRFLLNTRIKEGSPATITAVSGW